MKKPDTSQNKQQITIEFQYITKIVNHLTGSLSIKNNNVNPQRQ